MKTNLLVGALIIGLSSCSTTSLDRRITPLPEITPKRLELCHLLLESEKNSHIYKPREEDHKKLDLLLKKAKSEIYQDTKYDESQAVAILNGIHEIIREQVFTNTYPTLEEALSKPLFSQGVQEKAGHCFHHTSTYVSIAQACNLPMEVCYTPYFYTTNKLNQTTNVPGHVFIRWNLSSPSKTGKKYINWETTGGFKAEDNHFEKFEDKQRKFEIMSLDKFTKWAIETRLLFCADYFIGQTDKAIKDNEAIIKKLNNSKNNNF